MKQVCRNIRVRYSIRCLLTLIVCICTCNAYAQRYPFHNLSVDDGLIQSQATCLAQDKIGNLWVGTLGGLSRYNGRNFTNYTVRDGMQSNVVNALAVDTSGNIWVSSAMGISQFNGKSFVNYAIPGGTMRSPNISQQIGVAGDTTWWRAQGAVYFIAKGKITYYATPGGDEPVTAMLAEHEGIWTAKLGSVYHHINNRWDSSGFVPAPDQKPPNISRIFRDKEGTIYVTTNQGLYKLSNGHIVIDSVNGQPLNYLPAIVSITEDKSGALWLGTGSGVVKIAANTIQVCNKHNGLSDNRFFDMLTDAEGNVWMASDGQGIFRFSGTQFTGLDETMGLPSAQIMSIASNMRDSLFLATYDAGLYIFNQGKVSALAFPVNPTPSISCMIYTHGKLWIGTRGSGLWTYQHDIFRQYAAPERSFPSNYVSALYADTTGRIWIGFDNGVVVYDTDKFTTITDKRLTVVSFLTIGADSTLIATENSGLQLCSGSVLSDFITHTAADSAAIKCLLLQWRDIWMGSSDNGVIRYNMDTHKAITINKSNGLRSDFIYNISADNEQNIWVGTGFGIHKIKMTGSEPIVTFYGKAQGITGMESNLNSVLKLHDGSIWFGTTNGALHYQPHTAVVLSAPSGIVMESVKLTGEKSIDHSYYDSTDNWYGIPYHLQLPYKENNISFTYQAITLTGGQQVAYRYRMDGLETPWSDWTASNSVTYSALPPGKYTFHVQCRGSDGQSTPELAYPFEIITPFQKTLWFRLAVLGACLLSGIALQYIINSRKLRRKRLLDKLREEEQTKIRIRTAEDFHDEIGNKLTRINVLTRVLKSKITPTPDSTRILGQIEENTGQLYSGTRDILWSLQPSNDNLFEILYRIRDFGNELFQDTEVAFTFSGDDEKWRQYRLPMDMSRNLLMIFKEALNNCLKYSGATHVSVVIKWKSRGVLQIVLRDDGKGFDLQTVAKGNGINNMNVRTARLHGKIYIDSRPGKGTIINLTFKIPQNRG